MPKMRIEDQEEEEDAPYKFQFTNKSSQRIIRTSKILPNNVLTQINDYCENFQNESPKKEADSVKIIDESIQLSDAREI